MTPWIIYYLEYLWHDTMDHILIIIDIMSYWIGIGCPNPCNVYIIITGFGSPGKILYMLQLVIKRRISLIAVWEYFSQDRANYIGYLVWILNICKNFEIGWHILKKSLLAVWHHGSHIWHVKLVVVYVC